MYKYIDCRSFWFLWFLGITCVIRTVVIYLTSWGTLLYGDTHVYLEPVATEDSTTHQSRR